MVAFLKEGMSLLGFRTALVDDYINESQQTIEHHCNESLMGQSIQIGNMASTDGLFAPSLGGEESLGQTQRTSGKQFPSINIVVRDSAMQSQVDCKMSS